MPTKKTVAGLTAVAATAGAAALKVRRDAADRARWASAECPSGGDLGGPEGDQFVATAADGARIAGEVAGDGPLVVLIHGWVNHRGVWGPVAGRLVDQGFRVARYDQRGHGASELGDDEPTVEVLGDDLGHVLDELDAVGAVVGGHSMGGMAIQAHLGRHGSRPRVRAAALVATSSRARRVLPAGLAARAMASKLVDRSLGHPERGVHGVRGAFGDGPVLGHLEVCRDMVVDTEPLTRAGFVKAMATMDLQGHASRIDVPTAVLAGTRDRLTPLRESVHLATLVRGADLRVFPGSGHMLPLECPDAVAEAIVEVSARAAG